MARQCVNNAETLAHAAARAERLTALAAKVGRSTAGNAGLCDPIETSWLTEHICETDRHLFALRWFNPFGPTHIEFVLKAISARDAAFLVANQRHPFSPEAWVLGLLAPNQCDSAPKLLAVFRELARRKFGKASTFVNSSPTLALLPKGGVLGWPELKEIVRSLLEAVDAHDLEQAISYMRRFPGRPWERTAAERDDVFARFAPHLKANAVRPERPQRGPITAKLFDTWWACIVDPVHAGAEMTEFPRAWDGAIRFRRGEFSQKEAVEDPADGIPRPDADSSLINDEGVE